MTPVLSDDDLGISILKNAPIGVCLLDATTLKSEMVNEKFLEVAGKPYEAIYGQHYWDSFAEARPYYEVALQGVVNNGEPYTANEVVPTLIRYGKAEQVNVTFTYMPIKNLQGTVTKVAIWVLENTSEMAQKVNEELATVNEKVQSKLLKKGEDLEFAMNAANLATFDLNPVTGRFSGNDLLKYWFGLQPDDEIDIQTGINVVAEPDRERVKKALHEALQYDLGGNYDIEYFITSPSHPTPRMLRAKGKTKFDENKQPILLTGIVQDITEQKRDEQRKSDFISMVSHELKTPLTSMGGYVQILQARARKSEDALAAGMLDKANNQVKRMTTLINGFLNMARLDSGKIQIDTQRFDIAILMREIEDESRTIVFNHKIVFEPVEETFVLSDRDKIGQVVNNFISNAGKYSPMGTTIQVACITKGGKAHVTVKDEGMGIAPQDKEKLFDRFYRAQGATMGSIAGFGIGLYLCAEIIHRHGGEIGVESELGKGSEFYFTLPVVA